MVADERNEPRGAPRNTANVVDDDDDEVASTTTTASLIPPDDEVVENEETIHERQYRERRQRQQQLDRANIQRARQLESQSATAADTRRLSISNHPNQQSKILPGELAGNRPNNNHQHRHHPHKHHHNHHNHHHNHYNHHNHHHHHQHNRHAKHSPNHQAHGHTKEMIKPDATVRRARSPALMMPGSISSDAQGRVTAVIPASSVSAAASRRPNSPGLGAGGKQAPRQVATVVDEEQLHRRMLQSVSDKRLKPPSRPDRSQPTSASNQTQRQVNNKQTQTGHSLAPEQSHSSSSSSSSSSSHSSNSRSNRSSDEADGSAGSNTTGFRMAAGAAASDDMSRSPPPAAIIIPPAVARSLSMKASAAQSSLSSGRPRSPDSVGITREQLDYGTLLKSNEVQVLYRSPDSIESATGLDRHLKEEQAKQVAPNMKQSPIAIMSINPAYELQNKPLTIEYPATVENLRLNNTGFSWEVKIPYQISMTTALYGAHLNQTYRYRLDQFHCHWGDAENEGGGGGGGGSEHTVDSHSYSAEMHFVHYNMEKYHTLSKAARHPDGLVVLSVFIDAHPEHRNHAELDKIVSHLRMIPLKGEHSIIRQAVRIENLLPVNRSYWSYQGSLTTPPYLESVTWFVLKQPIRCNTTQIEKFRNLSSSVRRDDDPVFIRSNFRKTQPLNGRTVVMYDEQANATTLSSSQSSSRNL